MDENFDENQIKAYLSKDIVDFQLYNEIQIKKNLTALHMIRSSLQESIVNHNFNFPFLA